MPAHDLTPTAVMPTHDLTPRPCPAHDPTPTAMMPAHDPVPAATLAGDTAMGAALATSSGATRLMPAPPCWTACGPGTTPDWTRPATSISTTPAGPFTPSPSWPGTGTCWPARCSATRIRRTCRRGECRARVEATRAQILAFFRASPEEYEVIFTPNATGALRLVGESYPFGPGGRVPADLRQPQLGQRDPAVRPGQRRLGQLRPPHPRRPARIRGGAGPPSPGRGPGPPPPFRPPPFRPGRRQLVRVPGPVQLLRRPAPADLDRPGPGRRVRRAAGRRRVRAGQPAGSVPVAPGLRGPVVLQDLRLPDRDRGPAGAQAGAGQAAPPVVRRAARSPSPRSAPKRPPARGST